MMPNLIPPWPLIHKKSSSLLSRDGLMSTFRIAAQYVDRLVVSDVGRKPEIT